MKRFTYRDLKTDKVIFTINANDILLADEFFEENIKRKPLAPTIAVSVEEIAEG
jgi:hypothetical protein